MTDRPHDSEPSRVEQSPPETSSTRQDTWLGDRATDRMAQRADEPSRSGHGDYLRPTPEFQQALDDFKAEKAARQEDNGREGRLPDDRNYLRPTPEFQQALDDFKAEKAARQEAMADEPVEQRPSTDMPDVGPRDPVDRADAPATHERQPETDHRPPSATEPFDGDDPATGVASPDDQPAPSAPARERAADVPQAADVSDGPDGPPPDDTRGDTSPDDDDPPPDGHYPPPDGDDPPPDKPPADGGMPPPDGNDDGPRQPPDIKDVIAGLEPSDARGTERYLQAKEASEGPLIDDRQFAASLLGNLDVDTLSAAAKDTYGDVAVQLDNIDVSALPQRVAADVQAHGLDAYSTVLRNMDANDLRTVSEVLTDRKVSPGDAAGIGLVVMKCFLDRFSSR